ncbi:MAG: hypothetical protein J6X81_05505 [Muribaculaceae bacterium]|nr:hypothetical protein [Muribaculaceae bacterium]
MKNNNFKLRFAILIVVVIALCLNAFAATATYTVYSVTGDVHMLKNGKSVELLSRSTLRANDVIAIGEESAVTLLDEKNLQMIFLTSAEKGSVSSFVKKAKSKKGLNRQYFGYLRSQLVSPRGKKMSHPDTYMQATATSYRSLATDSLLLTSIVNILGAKDESVEKKLVEPQSVINTDLDVDFDLVRCADGTLVSGDVDGETGCYVRVKNNTLSHVYVNVLNIDEDGEKYLVLPVDEASLCAHLLVPPMSTIAFKSEPFVFGDDRSKETFMLVATKEPVDFSILMSPIAGGRSGKVIPTGISRKMVNVSGKDD